MGRSQGQRFDAFRLAASQGELKGTIAPDTLERLEDRLPDATADGTGDSKGRIAWSIRGAADEQGRPAITVSIEGTVPLECQRCLGLLDQPVRQSTTLLLARNEADLLHLDEISEHEVVLANAPLDPVTLVEDELLLTLPFAPRHEASCDPASAPAR
jgi:DUF177 domain-containing protein